MADQIKEPTALFRLSMVAVGSRVCTYVSHSMSLRFFTSNQLLLFFKYWNFTDVKLMSSPGYSCEREQVSGRGPEFYIDFVP